MASRSFSLSTFGRPLFGLPLLGVMVALAVGACYPDFQFGPGTGGSAQSSGPSMSTSSNPTTNVSTGISTDVGGFGGATIGVGGSGGTTSSDAGGSGSTGTFQAPCDVGASTKSDVCAANSSCCYDSIDSDSYCADPGGCQADIELACTTDAECSDEKVCCAEFADDSLTSPLQMVCGYCLELSEAVSCTGTGSPPECLGLDCLYFLYQPFDGVPPAPYNVYKYCGSE